MSKSFTDPIWSPNQLTHSFLCLNSNGQGRCRFIEADVGPRVQMNTFCRWPLRNRISMRREKSWLHDLYMVGQALFILKMLTLNYHYLPLISTRYSNT